MFHNVIFYSIQWGKETSTEWVIAMITSFFQSVLLLQPAKAVILAVLFALCIRKPADFAEGSNVTLRKEHSLKDLVAEQNVQPDQQNNKEAYLR